MVRDRICGVSVDALKDCCSHFNLSYVVTGSLLALISNFIQIEQKMHKLEIFSMGHFWLVGVVGQKVAVAI